MHGLVKRVISVEGRVDEMDGQVQNLQDQFNSLNEGDSDSSGEEDGEEPVGTPPSAESMNGLDETLPTPQKLLSFDSGEARLCDEGLSLITSVVCSPHVVVCVGDGRAGKSHLVNELIGRHVFETTPTPTAVTEGIDTWATFDTIYLDCEGGNNALAS